MKRRAICGAIGAILAAPLVIGQQAGPMRRIAILEWGDRASNESRWRLFAARLGELGYVEGKTLLIDQRWADASDNPLPRLARELLAGRPEVVLATGTTTTRALMRLTSSVPIVVIGVADPVATGLVTSLARPGGNVTGISGLLPDIAVKRIDLIREILPRAKQFGLLGPGDNAGVQAVLKQMQAAVRPRGLDVRLLDAGDPPAIARVFERLGAEPVDALIIASALKSHYRQILELAARSRIPASYIHKEALEDGGLTVYGPAPDAPYKHAADYAHRILQGAKPTEMPVIQPTEFWLGVNLRTARALGLKVPPSVLLRADRVIE